jgi:Spy/CpxP family protein refolding chaperone
MSKGDVVMRKGLVILTVIIGLALTGVSSAQMAFGKNMTGGCKMSAGPKGMDKQGEIINSFLLNPMIIQDLGLTPQQIDKLEMLKAERAKEDIDTGAEIAKLQIDIKMMMMKIDFDLNAIQAKIQKVSSLHTNMIMSGLKGFQQAKAVLTPEQKVKLEKLWKSIPPCKCKYKSRMKPGRPPGKSEIDNSEEEASNEPPIMGNAPDPAD